MRLLIAVLGVVALLALGAYFEVQGRSVASLVAFLVAVFWPWLAAAEVTTALEDRLAIGDSLED